MPRHGRLHARPDRLRHRRRHHDGRGGRQSRSPRTSCWRRWSWPTRTSASSAPAQLELQALRPASRSGTTRRSSSRARRSATARASTRRSPSTALAGVAHRRGRDPGRRAPAVSRPTPARRPWCAARRCAPACASSADARRAAAVKAPVAGAVRRRDPRACRTRSRTPRSSSRPSAQALVERIVAERAAAVPGRARAAVMDAAHGVGREGARSTRSTSRSCAPRSRSRSAAPTAARRTRSAQVTAQVGLTPRTHGSALFTRGQTQALTLADAGHGQGGAAPRRPVAGHDEALHPPLQLPAVLRRARPGFMRGPKRRDIGHGALAERALVPVIPKSEQFAYTIRAVSEILESNGSSSMASVCGSSLALMDAGVPITAPVAGIAMGLIKEGDDHVILTDIQGAEDHLGDMDFKVAGTAEGVTALQMDIKITGVTREILRDALARAKRCPAVDPADAWRRPSPSRAATLAEHAPQVLQTQIAPDQIGLLIGKGGETIRGLQDEFEVQIDIEEDGSVRIYGVGDHGDRCPRAHRADDAAGAGRRRVPRASASSRPPSSAPSSSSARARTACCTSRASRRACASTRPIRCCSATTSSRVEVTEVDADRGRIALQARRQARGRRRGHAAGDRRALQGAVPERRPAQRAPAGRPRRRGRSDGERRPAARSRRPAAAGTATSAGRTATAA